MLIAGVLKFDPQGRIYLSAKPALNFNGGTPIAADGGLAAALSGTAPDLHLAALGYLADGRLTDNSNPLVNPGGGVVTNGLGQIRISTDLPVYWYAGLPLTAAGHLACSPRGLP